MSYVTSQASPLNAEQHLQAIFNKFDLNRDGLLDHNELLNLFSAVGIRSNPSEVATQLKYIGNRVDFQQFKTFVSLGPRY